MSEPDSTPRRRPPTIDLTAKEIEAEGAASPQDSAAADAAAADGPAASRASQGGRNSRVWPYAAGVLIGAVAVAATVGGLWFAGVVPREAVAPIAPAARITAGDDVSSRLDKIEQALQTPRPDSALAGRMAAAEAQAKSLGDALAALARRVDEVAAASQSALAQAKSASVAAEEVKSAVQSGVQHGDVEALADRIATLESAVKSLRADVAQHAANADDSAARAVVVAEALRAAVERGAPYQAELATAKSLGADQNAVAALAPFAGDGVASAPALGRELSALLPALEQASEPQPKNGSFLGRLESRAQQLVRITPLDGATATAQPPGDDAASVIARLNVDANRGDIAAALADIAHLPEPARAPAAAWIKKAQTREAAIAASRRIAADALAAIAKPVSQ
jgi:hypothetical protein